MNTIPLATYRFQFTPSFGFREARECVEYLRELGVTCIYASPIFMSRPGSAHGYDVTDPTRLNPDLGTSQDFDDLMREVHRCGMTWMQDVVPNHMAFDVQNPILFDVLENGPRSRYFHFFDVEWDHPYEGIRGRLLAPFLGSFLGECLKKGEIHLSYGSEGFAVHYYDLAFPLRIESYATILTRNLQAVRRKIGRSHPDYVKLLGILGLLYVMKNVPPAETTIERYDQIRFIKVLLWELYDSNPDIRDFVDGNVDAFNSMEETTDERKLLEVLLLDQFYRLSFWKVAVEEINYRRFFNINGLIALRMEDQSVFEHIHSLVFDWIQAGTISGLRIDHVDGLWDPTLYLQGLRKKAGGVYLVVEKILASGEEIPNFWPVHGTTGYDFLNQVNGLFCDTRNEKSFERIWRKFTGFSTTYEELVSGKKRFIADKHMAGDIDNVTFLMKNIASRFPAGSDFTVNGLRRAVAQLLVTLPIYRTYLSRSHFRESDRKIVMDSVRRARDLEPDLSRELQFIGEMLLPEFGERLSGEAAPDWLRAVMKFQQLSGPIMAKGFEDSALYVYNRLLSLNDVGGHPNRFGVSRSAFHRTMKGIARRHPHTMLATSTHDTKRGEDVRARINVLSEIPQRWERAVRSWRKLNRKHRKSLGRLPAPHPNDEYFLYQTLVGSYPFREEERSGYVERIQAYMLKVVREAKEYSSWLKPNLEYEEAVHSFVEAILTPDAENVFLDAFLSFQKDIAFYGIFNSLSQVLLKLTCPGVPDFYQGTELWDLCLVDPDNRQPVDFEIRHRWLRQVRQLAAGPGDLALKDLLACGADGRIKLYVIHRGLEARRMCSDLFQVGSYVPLQVIGRRRHHVVAFCRRRGDRAAVTVVPRFLTDLVQPGALPLGEAVWHDTAIKLDRRLGAAWSDAFTGETWDSTEVMACSKTFARFPVALLLSS
jgi:(1->4)-alpha-D-glucan 1-alpha-D-glucosylmutase